jgi:phosphomannomutase
LDKIIDLVDLNLIKNSKLKVVIDTCCGAGVFAAPELLKRLGVEFVQINGEPELSKCQRGLEPLPENITALSDKVKEAGADIGLAQDPDGDRLAIVDERGVPIGEDYTLCLISEYLLKLRQAGKFSGENKICTNLSTTRIIDDVAQKFGAEVVRTKIGEINVSLAMQQTKAVVGGEGNGGIMIPQIGFGRDSLAGIAFILQYLADTKLKVSELVAGNPRYVMYKTKIECTSQEQVCAVLNKVKEKYFDEKLNDIDGIKVVFEDGNWLHVRASNTEPIIRIYSEAESQEKAKAIAENFIAVL